MALQYLGSLQDLGPNDRGKIGCVDYQAPVEGKLREDTMIAHQDNFLRRGSMVSYD
jgi:hypothetical protein